MWSFLWNSNDNCSMWSVLSISWDEYYQTFAFRRQVVFSRLLIFAGKSMFFSVVIALFKVIVNHMKYNSLWYLAFFVCSWSLYNGVLYIHIGWLNEYHMSVLEKPMWKIVKCLISFYNTLFKYALFYIFSDDTNASETWWPEAMLK